MSRQASNGNHAAPREVVVKIMRARNTHHASLLRNYMENTGLVKILLRPGRLRADTSGLSWPRRGYHTRMAATCVSSGK